MFLWIIKANIVTNSCLKKGGSLKYYQKKLKKSTNNLVSFVLNSQINCANWEQNFEAILCIPTLAYCADAKLCHTGFLSLRELHNKQSDWHVDVQPFEKIFKLN